MSNKKRKKKKTGFKIEGPKLIIFENKKTKSVFNQDGREEENNINA